MKVLNTINNIAITNEMVSKITKAYRFKGKDFYYKVIMNEDANKIKEKVIERDVFFVSKLLKLKVSDQRMRLLIKNGSQPKSKTEEVVSNLMKMFDLIQNKDLSKFELISNSVIELNRVFLEGKRVRFKNTTNKELKIGLTNKLTGSKREILDVLFKEYSDVLSQNSKEDIMVLIGMFVDFINIEPLENHNNMTAFLLFYIMLLKMEFNVFRYSSFFELLFNNKEKIDNSIHQSSFNWEQGFPQIIGFYMEILNIIIEGYIKVEKVVSDYEFDADLNKSDNVENTIQKLGRIFTKNDIRIEQPYVSDSTIDRTLKRMKEEGKIKPLGTGRSAKWVKVNFDDEQISFGF